MTEAARAEAFAKQADRSREIAEGLVRQGQSFLNRTRAAQELVAEYLRKHGIQHKWDGTNLSILTPTGVYGDSVDLRGMKGDVGPAPVLEIGTIGTSDPGSAAEASITGGDGHYLLHLALPRGEEGPVGPPDGNTVLNGEAEPASGLGKDGDFYLRTSNWDIYGPKTAGEWGEPASLSANIDFEELAATLGGKLDKDGGAMTGPLVLAGDPEEDDQAANKAYVDAQTAGFEKAEVGRVVYAADPPAAGYLPADGSAYLRADYPELGALMPTRAPTALTTVATGTHNMLGIDTDGNGIWIGVMKNASNQHVAYRSTDDGVSYTTTTLDSSVTGADVTFAAIAADGDDWVIAFRKSTTEIRYLRSSNKGASWTTGTISTALATGAYSLKGHGGVFFMGTGGANKLVKTTDGGVNWSAVALGIGGAEFVTDMAAFDDGRWAFASTSGINAGPAAGPFPGVLTFAAATSSVGVTSLGQDMIAGQALSGSGGLQTYVMSGDIVSPVTNNTMGTGALGQLEVAGKVLLARGTFLAFSYDQGSTWPKKFLGPGGASVTYAAASENTVCATAGVYIVRGTFDPANFVIPKLPDQGPLKAYIYAGEAA